MNLKIVSLVVVGGCAAGFGSGVLVGRQFPARRFEKYGETRFLLNAATGKICDPFKDPNNSTNPADHLFDPSYAPKDSNGSPVVQSSYPPACGK